MKGMSPSLSLARDGFVAALKREASGAEHARMVAVLDALLAWSLARPTQVAFRVDDRPKAVLTFERVGSKTVVWSARVIRGEGAKLELSSATGRSLSDESRAMVLQTLNAHSRVVLVDGDPLRISFAALKNTEGRAAVLALMERLLLESNPAAQSARAPALSTT